MLKARIYSLYDREMRQFGDLMIAPNDAVMIRSLQDSLPAQSLPARRPGDFDLMWLGSVSLESGVIAAGAPQLVKGLKAALEGGYTVTPVQEGSDGIGSPSDGGPLA